MIDIALDPDLHLGGLRLAWHSVFALVGMAAGVVVAARFARGIATFAQVYSIGLTGIVGGLIGSRVLHVVEQWPAYAPDPITVLAVWNGGASITGGMVGGTIAGIWQASRLRIDVGRFLDAGAIGLGVGMAIGRIGDVINGEHHALACDGLPWCVRYTHPNTLGQSSSVHPAVAYEMAWDLVAAAIVAWVFPRAPRWGLGGRLIAIFFGLYGIGRLAIGALRLDPPWLLGIQQAQLVSVLYIGLAAVAILTRRRERPSDLS